MKAKKRSIIGNVILFIILFLPFYFLNSKRIDLPLFEVVLDSAWKLLAVFFVGGICGFVVTFALYWCGNIYAWYLGMVEGNMEKSVAFEEEWNFKKVFNLSFQPCCVLSMIVLYILSIFVWK